MSNHRRALRSLLVLLALIVFVSAVPAAAQFTTVGGKLTPQDDSGVPGYGTAGGLSADGATLVVGGWGDNGNTGATWVFGRTNGAWSQEGNKLVASDPTGPALQGNAVAISGDGNTLAVGGPGDNTLAGATWIFARSGGPWVQQGNKIVGTGAVGKGRQGFSVALSADGNTLAVGAPYDNSNVGAVWVFTRTGGTWTQQGNRLVATGEVGPGDLGYSVALSGDGNTLVVGGATDNGGVGATWVFTRTGSTWTQQGSKLVGSGATGAAQQGISVALSADGTTLAAGGNADNSLVGATWVFTRIGASWIQQGGKLVGTGWTSPPWQGIATALSGDGKLLLVGGTLDGNTDGAAWAFGRTAGVWVQLGGRLIPANNSASPPHFGSFVAASADGNTQALGAPNEDAPNGAAWIFARPAPPIVSVTDVPNDQGGEVSVRWKASVLDATPADPVASYGVWRQVPAGGSALRTGTFRTTATTGGATLYWELVGSEPARGLAGYSFTAPTSADSIAGSNPRTLFMVDTEQPTLGQYWPSDPDSGYSVDNLGPLPPAGAAGTYSAGAAQLFWNPNSETDLAGYRLYRGAPSTFPISPASLVATLGAGSTSYLDAAGKPYVYKLTAVDVHGNESAPTTVLPGGVTAVTDPSTTAFTLAAPSPNPVAGAMAIRFALPLDERALLVLYDAAGRRVRTLVDGAMTAGEHGLRWDPRAESPVVGDGIYFLRLTAGGRTLVQRLAIVG